MLISYIQISSVLVNFEINHLYQSFPLQHVSLSSSWFRRTCQLRRTYEQHRLLHLLPHGRRQAREHSAEQCKHLLLLPAAAMAPLPGNTRERSLEGDEHRDDVDKSSDPPGGAIQQKNCSSSFGLGNDFSIGFGFFALRKLRKSSTVCRLHKLQNQN